MRIQNTTNASGLRDVRNKNKAGTGDGSFSVGDETGDAGASAQSLSVSNVQGLDALLSLQDVEDATSAKRRTAARGFDLLDRLEELRTGLLGGRLSAAQVDQIAHKIKLLGRTGDVRLDSILADIDMRARVELAKLGVYDI
ncbi:MAG: flagellar assembly protein FliX [Pseudomonadota bacterium]